VALKREETLQVDANMEMAGQWPWLCFYPEPRNAPHLSPGMIVPNFPEGKRSKAMDVHLWYGVYGDFDEYHGSHEKCARHGTTKR